MITGKDIYEVLAALVPLYVAMMLAYASVRWWKIFSPEQCAGINRFVAVFAVPLLSFHFISANNPYIMNFRFIAADSLQKILILVALVLWRFMCTRSTLDWCITLFSLSTLPNTLVMGVPLLRAMYGDFSASLMVQIVVLQSVVWYTLMLFMFEYRGAKLLISDQFPNTAASITSFHVESDVVSLSGREPLQADAEVGDDGKLRVVVRRSMSSSARSGGGGSSYGGKSQYHWGSMTSRPSNLTGVEIYSIQSSRQPTPRASSFNQADFVTMFSSKTASLKHNGGGGTSNVEGFGLVGSASGGGATKSGRQNSKDLQMFVWSSSASPVSERNLKLGVNNNKDFGSIDTSEVPLQQEIDAARGMEELLINRPDVVGTDINKNGTPVTQEEVPGILVMGEELGGVAQNQQELPASVMTRLILIMVWRKLIRNPNTYASVIGLVWSFISFGLNIKFPLIVSASISILSDAGLGMAMFSLGLFMALQPKIIASGKIVALFSLAVRFLAGPIVIAAASVAVGLRGSLLRVSIIQAALPQGIVPFVFAKEYNIHADILSTAVIFGMLIALPVTIVYYVVLELC